MNYYLLMAGKILLILMVTAAGVRCLYLLAKCRKKFMTANILHAIRPSQVHGKGVLFFITLFFVFFSGIVVFETSRQNTSLHIALTYPEASQGLNPNGSRYNMSNILSDEVLEAAIEFGGFENLTVDGLRSALDIAPVQSSSRASEESGELVSTQFELTFSNNRKTKNLSGREVVFAVGYAYRNWFINEYSPNCDVLDISFDDIQSYDYPDLNNYFSNAIQIICNLSSSFHQKDATFQSPTTGESFYSINSKAWDINNTGLENLNSFIMANGLSEDRDDYLSRLRYEYTNLCNDYRSTIQAYDVRIEAVQKYDNDMATVVYIPTYDTDNTFYMSKTKIGIDHFSADADLLSNSASTILASILDGRYLLQRLEETPGGTGDAIKAEEMIAVLKEEILTLADVLERTIFDYVTISSNGYISLTEPANFWLFKYGLTVGFGVAFFMFVYLGKGLRQLSEKSEERKAGENHE